MGKFKKKLFELKAKIEENEEAIFTVVLGVAGAVGWALAGYYSGKNQSLEQTIDRLIEVEEDAWPFIEISPRALQAIEDGKTLMYRQYSPEPNRVVCQMTTSDEGFPAEADDRFNQYRKPSTPEETSNA